MQLFFLIALTIRQNFKLVEPFWYWEVGLLLSESEEWCGLYSSIGGKAISLFTYSVIVLTDVDEEKVWTFSTGLLGIFDGAYLGAWAITSSIVDMFGD